MKITLIGGVVDRVKSLTISTRKYFTKERMIALSLLSRIVGMVLLMSVIPLGSMKVEAQKEKEAISTIQPKVAFDVQKSVPLKLTIDQPEVVIGESEYLRKEREAREEEEARKAQLAIDNRDVYVRDEYRPAPPADPDLATKRALAKRAAEAYGIDWKILEAVWQVESGKAWYTPTCSYAGACGPMQFMPGTWGAYAVDGNGDGIADIRNAEDAVFAGARLLAAGGAASGNVDQALYNYNHAWWYVEMVKEVANSIID